MSHVVERITKWNKTDRNIDGNYEGKRLGEIWGYESDRLFQVDDFNVTTDANGKKVYTLKDEGNGPTVRYILRRDSWVAVRPQDCIEHSVWKKGGRKA